MDNKQRPVCGQVNIPQVDNTSLGNTEIIDSKYVLMGTSSIRLGLTGDETLYDFVKVLEDTHSSQSRQVSKLKSTDNTLFNEIDRLEKIIESLKERINSLENK